jgi:hypothetical protein
MPFRFLELQTGLFPQCKLPGTLSVVSLRHAKESAHTWLSNGGGQQKCSVLGRNAK